MSAYAHQMERQFSAQSLSSRGGSAGTDVESQYPMESGFYMTSFAATIFIAAIVTIGILMVTLLITLTVMLQSCESQSAGVIENKKLDDEYNRCKILALHAELNRLRTGDFPSDCKNLAARYIKEGQYGRDLNDTLLMAESYFSGVTPLEDGLDVVLMDIDDIFASRSRSQCNDQLMHCDSIEEAQTLKCELILTLYTNLQAGGWNVILLSRMLSKRRTAAIDHLVSAGFGDRSSLIMRLDSELHIDDYEYFSRRRESIQKQGFRITSTISSRISALTGPFSGSHVLKLPNPIYYSSEHYSNFTTSHASL